jgi:peptide/nickel transport system substrate-binding protein
VTEIATSVATWSNDYETGRYEMADGFTDTYPNPWLTYNALLNSDESAPIGQVAPSNYERWDNTATDAALNQYAATTNPTVQHRLMSQIETTLFKDVPVISLFYGPVWYEYQTNAYTGWPTPSNPYADPSNAYPSSLLMVTRIHPIS